jgi:Fe-S cluster assembly protein SufD
VSQDAPPGVVVSDLATAARTHADVVRPLLEADGLTPQEQKFTSLNTAFHHDGVFVRIPSGWTGSEPIRLVRLLSVSPQAALFPLTVIVVGEGSTVSLIHEDVGVGPAAAVDSPHTINGRIELVLEPNASVRYCRIQRWDAGAHEFLLQRATLQEGAQLDMVNINIGGRVTKSHVIAKLLGPRAASRVYGFVSGHGRQHVDFHSLQDHQAPRTFSDLLYKAALTDASRMIYTGLIRIAKPAKQTDAYQANHNLLLSQRARAETIPMLEILADDVRCKHGATIGPVDEEQLFYLMTRGIPRALAERVLVMGFVEPIIQQVPGEALQQRLREELEGSLEPAQT